MKKVKKSGQHGKTLVKASNCNTTQEEGNKDEMSHEEIKFDAFVGDQVEYCRNLPNKNDIDFTDKNGKSSDSFTRCTQQHRHKHFTTLSELKLQDLPDGHRNNCLLDYVKTIGQLVVKITVHETSQQRNITDRYHLPIPDNFNIVRQGTGWLGQVPEDAVPNTIVCPFVECSNADRPHEVIGPFYVMTAKHLVFDRSEALSAEIFFSDDTSSEDASDSDWTAIVHDIAYPSNEDRDFVYLKCYCHDMDIFPHLRSIATAVETATTALSDADFEIRSNKDCAFIISHPHGRGKHVSFGTVEKKEDLDVESVCWTGEKTGRHWRYTYDIPTCPGSSGAAVCIMGLDSMYHYHFPHSINTNGMGVNSGLVDWLDT